MKIFSVTDFIWLMKCLAYSKVTIEVQLVLILIVWWPIYFKVFVRSHVFMMHYASFSLQGISHDWNRIQTHSFCHPWIPRMPIFQRRILWIFYRTAKPVILLRTLWTLTSDCHFPYIISQLFSVHYRQSLNIRNHYFALFKFLHRCSSTLCVQIL